MTCRHSAIRRFPDNYVHRPPAFHGPDRLIVRCLAHQHAAFLVELLRADRDIVVRIAGLSPFLEPRFGHAPDGVARTAQAFVCRHVAFRVSICLADTVTTAQTTRGRRCQISGSLFQAHTLSDAIDHPFLTFECGGNNPRRNVRIGLQDDFDFFRGKAASRCINSTRAGHATSLTFAARRWIVLSICETARCRD